MPWKTASLRLYRLLAVGVLSIALPVLAQSLGDVARREQEKKEKKRAPAGRSYTDEDLKAGRNRRGASFTQLEATASPSPASAPSPEASPSPEPDRYVLEREWRRRFAEARARISEADARAWEDRIEVVFVAGIPVQQRVRVKVETPDLRAARQALDQLEEDLRRAGLPPGWGRE
jgi:hypothetical protein